MESEYLPDLAADHGEVTLTEDEQTLGLDLAPTRPGPRRFRRQKLLLRNASPEMVRALEGAASVEEARTALFDHIDRAERALLGVETELSFLERANAQTCMQVLKSVFAPVNEKRVGFSALECLWKVVHGRAEEIGERVTRGFLAEFIHLFRGVSGRSGIYRDAKTGAWRVPSFLRRKGRKAALQRSDMLDGLYAEMKAKIARYPSGMGADVVRKRRANRDRILARLGGTEDDWNDWRWQLEHVVKTPDLLAELVEIPPAFRDAVARAGASGIPVGITPYYLGLMNFDPAEGGDHAIRAQVIPPPDYVDRMAEHKKDREFAFDFMGEHDTSPVDLVTRRYPRVAILKPYNTCSQICVYCQRNWEIDDCLDPHALASPDDLDAAIEWFARHPAVGDVLVTGGDPAVTDDAFLDDLLGRLASIPHVYRIRLATRTPVVLPMRWTDSLTGLLARVHEPGRREVCVITHFEHPYEISPEARDAVRKIRQAGMAVYNQVVYTMENSRRFEAVKLRLDLRSIGVDPYYTFNMKGKEETRMYRVPIARLLQERKEEARLLPGLDRTDEPVFNVPRLGKNHLRASQDRRLIAIRPDGRRVYEFHPWEKNIALVPPYIYTDVSIQDYLQRLHERGEDLTEYRTIWYYY